MNVAPSTPQYPSWALDFQSVGTPIKFGAGQHVTGTSPGSVDQLAAIGGTATRVDVVWNDVEQALGVYAWNTGNAANALAMINECVVKGMTCVVVLKWSGTGNALYAGNIVTGSATQNTQYALFCQWVANQLIGKTNYLEIYNEFDANGVSGTNYKAIQDAVWAVIKNAGSGNPNAIVCGGVCSGVHPGNALNYYFGMSTSPTADRYDYHYYPSDKTSENAINSLMIGASVARCDMFNQAIRTCITEWGFQDSETSVNTTCNMAQWVLRMACMPLVDINCIYNQYDDSTSLTWGLYSGTLLAGSVLKTRGQAWSNMVLHNNWATAYRRSFSGCPLSLQNLQRQSSTFNYYRAIIFGNGTTERGFFWAPNGTHPDTINIGVQNEDASAGTLTVTDEMNNVLQTFPLAVGMNMITLTLNNTVVQCCTANVNISFLPFAYS